MQVSGNKNLNGADAAFWCGLIDIDKLDSVFRDIGWDIDSRTGYPGHQ